MTPERYRQIGELYHAALEIEDDQRAAFLDRNCAGDDELRREVDSLIASHEHASGFIAAPALTIAAELLASSETDALIGQTVARYKIISLLGAGGMGRVYLAEDTELGRRVALKFLPEYFTHDQNQVRRFRQEARTASALNHPNIAHIYEIGQARGLSFIALEYVEGETLGAKIHGKKTGLNQLLEWLAQVADGLAKAHSAGVVHRDLKPDNIMITRDGYAKILDFGLAKLVEAPIAATGSGDFNEAATARMSQLSQPGMVMGTIGYMSPEQAQGKPVDLRSDIFSFGCILYQAATGRKPFEADSVVASLHKTVYEAEPPLGDLNPSAPLELQQIVSRCLMKDAEERYQTIKDVTSGLRELRRDMESGAAELHRSAASSLPGGASPRRTGDLSAQDSTAAATGQAGDLSTVPATSSAEYLVNEIKRHKWRFVLVLSLVGSVLAAAGFGLYKLSSRDSAARSGVPLKVTPLTSSPYIERHVAFSPDGKQIAYVWTGEKNDSVDIYIKLVGVGEPLRLTNNPGYNMSPAWSPDGRYIAFQRGKGEGKGFYIIPALGGAERKLADAYEWKDVPLKSSQSLAWSPDGKTLAVVDKTSEDEPWSIFLIAVESGERSRLTQPPIGYEGDQFVGFSPDGSRLAFVRAHFVSGDIYTVPVTGGEPTRITSDETAVISGLAWTPDGASLVFSSDRGGGNSTLWRVAAAGGTPTTVPGVGDNVYDLSLARQGDRLAYAQLSVDFNIYRLELRASPGGRRAVGAPASFLTTTRMEAIPRFSPDGRRVAFISNRSGSDEVWVCDAEGKNPAQLTNFGGPHSNAPSWSPDGRLIAFASLVTGNGDIYVVGADGGSPHRLTNDLSAELEPTWSSDGHWLYFSSNRTGRSEVWKMPAAGGAAIQVTHSGGQNPAESPDGRMVYYLKGEGEFGLWQVSPEGGEETQVFAPPVAAWNWAAVTRGIYFLTARGRDAFALEFFDFATRQMSEVAKIERPNPMSFISAITVSPDERWVLYAQRDKIDFDLMLVENFR